MVRLEWNLGGMSELGGGGVRGARAFTSSVHVFGWLVLAVCAAVVVNGLEGRSSVW